ncbi:2Fe-2S iron-sulfur cluster-binding protein [Paracoccus versutus]|uniref:2Fe-2S ferredoxin n=1 Tax=Paracoccus versutus TaxID=34007 RepID=A0A3D9Y2A7_PARVE|nr:2Fe-2S iron-sulfur cluster-binding protein [Paracoccus versutus]REF73319.1 2Fe-2S ferredoxin [Paracoccus versutus]WGR54659.1 2Fe-2S iron-sulfur cluster binding domain-containing protein [Paracoccus versutus]
MPKITYIEASGLRHDIDVPVGHTVMEGGRDAGVEGIVAECGGSCSCSTCHVHVAPEWVDKIPSREEMEEDMLDFAIDVDPVTSRLSCQIRVTEALDGLVVHVAKEQA